MNIAPKFINGSKCEHIGQSNNEIRIRKEISVKQIIAYQIKCLPDIFLCREKKISECVGYCRIMKIIIIVPRPVTRLS